MPIPTSMEIPMKLRPRPAGTIIEVYPSTVQGLSVEIQSATASAAASSLWSSVILPPSSAGVWRYAAQIPESTKTFYFKARYPAQPGYSAGPFTATVSKKPGILPPRRPWDGTFRISTPLNRQGSALPYVTPGTAGTFFSYNTGGPGSPAGKGWASFSWSSSTIYYPDGSTGTVPAPVSALAAPTVTEVAGGALAIRTRYVRIGYVKTEPGTFETVIATSAETTFTTSAINKLLKVTSPANPGGGLYDGWCVLVGSASSQNFVQNDPAVIPFGTDWTELAGGFSTTDNSRYTPSWLNITFISLLDTTVHYFYPYYHGTESRVRIPVTDGGRSATLAQVQNGDGMISLGQFAAADGFSGAITITTPASGATASGSRGGGRLM